MIRTRIAPSPTGYLHIGTARTALFNYLFAKKHKGSFIVRIEDTDVERSKKEFEKDILDGLRWLGMDWDEGPDMSTEYGPYRQSERLATYRMYLEELIAKNLLYPWFFTKEELEEEREMQVLSKQPPRYSGKCRVLNAQGREQLVKEGRASTLRFKIEQHKTIAVHDLIRGDLSFDPVTLDDFIIAKDLDTPLYNFAVVVDDYLMKISHIIRGEEHIANIPKQVLIDEALGFPIPQFAHLPLILNPDRTKLSKRQNKVSLLEYRTDGYLPEALINFMVLLGWNPGGDREIFTLQELGGIFDLDHVNKSGSIFDTTKLDWFNAHYLRAMDIRELTTFCIPYFVTAGYVQESSPDVEYLQKVVALERDRIHRLSEITAHTGYYFQADLEYEDHLLIWKQTSLEDIKKGLQLAYDILEGLDEALYTTSSLEEVLKAAIISAGLKNGVVLWPLRVALTGLGASPSPFEVSEVLGKQKTLSRVRDALKRLSAPRS